jgi:flavin-dependent dehydrogenase
VCIDVAVIGGGPSGALTARNIARAGRRVILIDAALRQATRIGEALVPSARVILEEIELFDAFVADGHLPSFGNESSWGSPDLRRTEFIRSPHGHGWHVDRTSFDALLRRSARDAGVLVLEHARLMTFRADPDGTWILSASGPDGLSSCRTRWLVDATGRSGFVARRLGVRRITDDRLLAFSSLFRPEYRGDLDSLSFVESVEDGWWYTALLSSGVRTVTFFTDAGLPAANAARTRQGFLSLLSMTVHVSRRLEPFRYEIADGPQATDARTSRLERFCGSGWIAVGDAAISFDPLSSQGLLTALYGGLKAAAALVEQLESGGKSLERYEQALLRVYESFTANRLEYYGFERRWADSPFWKSRHGRSG